MRHSDSYIEFKFRITILTDLDNTSRRAISIEVTTDLQMNLDLFLRQKS